MSSSVSSAEGRRAMSSRVAELGNVCRSVDRFLMSRSSAELSSAAWLLSMVISVSLLTASVWTVKLRVCCEPDVVDWWASPSGVEASGVAWRLAAWVVSLWNEALAGQAWVALAACSSRYLLQLGHSRQLQALHGQKCLWQQSRQQLPGPQPPQEFITVKIALTTRHKHEDTARIICTHWYFSASLSCRKPDRSQPQVLALTDK